MKPVVVGPIPYFSTEHLYFGECPLCPTYKSGKCTSEAQARRAAQDHINAKHPESK